MDLRDGNQALAQPMSVEEKLEFFELLVRISFKEIEVGFPSASQIEFDFTRRLIEENRIPDDVSIQILCQGREDLVARSLESLRGREGTSSSTFTALHLPRPAEIRLRAGEAGDRRRSPPGRWPS